MDWGRIAKSRWVPVIGALIWAPGILDAFAFWQRTVGDMSAGWQGALIGVGAGIFGVWLFGMAAHYGDRVGWPVVRAYARALAGPLIVTALAIILLGGMIYYLAFVHEWTKTAWMHPTLSAAEQEKAKAVCEMRAIEVGGSGPRFGSARYEYEAACLTSRGFESKEVKR